MKFSESFFLNIIELLKKFEPNLNLNFWDNLELLEILVRFFKSRKFRFRFYSNFVRSSIMLRKNDSINFIKMSAMSFEKIHFQEKWRYFYFVSYVQTAPSINKTIYQHKLAIITALHVQIWERSNHNWRSSWSFIKSARREFISLEIP